MIALTPAGQKLIDQAFTEHMANEHRLLAELSNTEKAQLESLLTHWLAHYEQ
jgi:DNA-binding MarR family transcriptional regulator